MNEVATTQQAQTYYETTTFRVVGLVSILVTHVVVLVACLVFTTYVGVRRLFNK